MNLELAIYFLPQGILDYFDLVSHKLEQEVIHFYLDEKNVLP
jgi:hypothetical protein